ncbi:small integral membrane protein 15-like [Lycorma delicatula]|uniref:small integral membrane protein 15-like n=1 Tax=Lycorma delicatula TaxID=130591 RepID=UPI003F50DECE
MDDVIRHPTKELNIDPGTWEGWFNSFILWAGQNPWNFIYNILLILSPFFIISLLLSWKLAKALEHQKKDKKKKLKKESNTVKTRKTKVG